MSVELPRESRASCALTRRQFLGGTAAALLPSYTFLGRTAVAAPSSLGRAGEFGELDATQPGGIDLVLERLPELGISIDNVTRQLEDEGVEKFNKPFDKLMETLAQRSAQHLTKES